MIFQFVIRMILAIVNIIPFDIPSLPSVIANFITKLFDFLLNMIGMVKVILPWDYLVILLELSLVIYFCEKMYLFFKFVLKFIVFIFEKTYDILITLPTKLTDLIKAFFG